MNRREKVPRIVFTAVAVLGAFGAAGAVGALAVARRSSDGSERSDGDRPAITAPVELSPLEMSMVVRASVVNVDEVTIVAPPRADGQTASVVTRAPPATGAPVEPGISVIEINGRPIMVLAMSVPLFRDITPGTSGPDVSSLQRELTRLGFEVSGDEVAVFGPASQSAVGDLFDRAGYEPAFVAGSRGAFEAGLATAERAADDALDAANRSRAGGVADPALDAAVGTAQQAVTSFKASQGVELRSSETARISRDPVVVAGPAPTIGASVAAEQPLVTLAAPHPEVQAQLTDAQASLISSKSVVQVTGGGYSATCAPGQIVSPDPGGEGTADESVDAPAGNTTTTEPGGDATTEDGVGVTFTLVCDPKPTLASLGSDYVATVNTKIAVERLLVPATSVISTPSGRTFVDVADRPGSFVRVAVDVMAEAGGFVSIEASSGHLEAGDRVRVSRR